MSNEFLEKYGDTPVTRELMREWCQRPGEVDKNGKPFYVTEQHHKKECDINTIIKKFDKTGLLTHVSKIEQRFGDATALEFKDAMDLVVGSRQMFDELPAEIRTEFDNDPGKLIEFMDDENNRPRAIELGLIRESWPEAVDGIGEHVEDLDGDPSTSPTPVEKPPA